MQMPQAALWAAPQLARHWRGLHPEGDAMSLQLVLPMQHLRSAQGAHLQLPLALSPMDLAELQAARWHT